MQAILRKRVSNSKGVTLLELLAVLVILGIIALIAVPAIAGVIDDSRANSVKASAINMINAAELYATTNTVDISEVEYGDIKDKYVKDRSGFTWSSQDSDKPFVDTGTGIAISGIGEIENVSVNFTEATINDINDNSDNVTVTIK
ncbi:type II secretion system protein [Allobacillus sp. GCM10007491]|uniref:Prepilin-type N-terminal cleavage/methylation domain-containing protein n=1 Tax=Allobacillus saliphilus TaxID=2912308 RepID=A0A941CUY2_9BACI|nr:prepilin-type N-terminal cleavage/methylation domain-containing protein [Allobacillus saliphilus]MBR7554443.1 prepilin-type N-terminal cleavage/methylation domain-containing protein [Allobacillus saliphilus]